MFFKSKSKITFEYAFSTFKMRRVGGAHFHNLRQDTQCKAISVTSRLQLVLIDQMGV